MTHDDLERLRDLLVPYSWVRMEQEEMERALSLLAKAVLELLEEKKS